MKKSYKGLTGFWTKWGGRVHSPLDNQYASNSEWFCQSCGEKIPAQLMKWKVRMNEKNDYFSVCSLCYADKWASFWVHILTD